MHAKAVVNGKAIAETDNYEEVEGNVYVSSWSIESTSIHLKHELTKEIVPTILSRPVHVD